MSSERPSAGGRVREYLRQHHVALISLFLVLTGGTAYALDGQNTVFSDDIVNRQVRPADLGIVPAVRATQPAGISIFDGVTCQSGVDVGAGGEYLIPFGGEDYDVGPGGGMHVTTPPCDNSTARLTARLGGIYLITAAAAGAGSTTTAPAASGG